jgi:uncharacterized protein YukE
MADNGYEVDTTKLARHAAEFPGFADQVGAIHRELTTALDAAGPCWGGDAPGQSFADGHVQPSSGTLDRINALPGQLSDVGDRFTATAAGYRQADEYGKDLLTGGQ